MALQRSLLLRHPRHHYRALLLLIERREEGRGSGGWAQVGYGHSTPATTWGKAFCILYALAGIPLGLVMFQVPSSVSQSPPPRSGAVLQSIGERLNALISAVLTALKRELNIQRELQPSHLIFVSFAVGSVVICFGTYVFHRPAPPPPATLN